MQSSGCGLTITNAANMALGDITPKQKLGSFNQLYF